MDSSGLISALALFVAGLSAFVVISGELRTNKDASPIEFVKSTKYAGSLSDALNVSQALISGLFGTRIFSWRAFRKSIIISMILFVAAALVFILRYSEIGIIAKFIAELKSVGKFQFRISYIARVPFILTVLCLLSEFLYISKSRLLLRTISFFKRTPYGLSDAMALVTICFDVLTTVVLFCLISPLFLIVLQTYSSFMSVDEEPIHAFIEITCFKCPQDKIEPLDATKHWDTYKALVGDTFEASVDTMKRGFAPSLVELNVFDKGASHWVEKDSDWYVDEQYQIVRDERFTYMATFQGTVLYLSLVLQTALATTVWTAMLAIILIGSRVLYAYNVFQRGVLYVFTHPSFVRHVAVVLIFLFFFGLYLVLRNLEGQSPP